MTTQAYGATAADRPLGPMEIERREPGPRDVAIDILHCGVCHSDLHQVRGEWAGTVYPCVPGHEIVGRVFDVGVEVTRFAAGDLVGVGCMVDSCGHCGSCRRDLEQFCENGTTFTYNSPSADAPGHTLGGYSGGIVVDEGFVLNVRHDASDLAGVAPLLCAGITTWSPLCHWGVGEGSRVGIVGIGGLGHMGIKLAHALGAHVVAFTTSERKRDDALALGAAEVVVSTDARSMAAMAGSLDFVLDTVAASHDLDAYVDLLKVDGTLVLVGVPENPHPSPSVGGLVGGRRAIAGSMIGGIAETQELLDFCADRGIVADVEPIRIQQIDEAFERMKRGDVKYRFVIDASTLPASSANH